MIPVVGDHFFRHEYGRLVAMFTRRLGPRYLSAIEDAVQSALLAAVESWPLRGVPHAPSAWLYRVASNQLADEFRTMARRGELALAHSRTLESESEPASARLSGEVRDDVLNLLFVCCHESLPVESQLVLALETLCGFGVKEIAARLFLTEANVYKRSARAKGRLQEVNELDVLSNGQLLQRLPAVQLVLYTLFTEGYLSSHATVAIRRELCDEATQLASSLAAHPLTATSETHALLALMHLHTARLDARQDASGGLLLLQEQDRSRWDHDQIAFGLAFLARASEGDNFSRFHAEAGIAAEHCLAPSFEETRWERIAECYELLDRVAPSALHTLNRALAVAECRGAVAALELVEHLTPPAWLEKSYQWSAVLADLHRRVGNAAIAERYRVLALESAPSVAIRDALARRLRQDDLQKSH